MAHMMYDAVATARVAGDAMGATVAQASRMARGAMALRRTSEALAVALDRRDAALDRRDQARARLVRAKAARAALKA